MVLDGNLTQWVMLSRSVVSRSPSWGIKVPSKRGTDYQRLSGLGSCSWFVWRFFCKRKSRKTMHGIEVMFDYCVCLVEWFCWIYDYLKVETIGVWSVSLARRSEDESVVKKDAVTFARQEKAAANICYTMWIHLAGRYAWRGLDSRSLWKANPCFRSLTGNDCRSNCYEWKGMKKWFI